jgi:hypothetical protein
MTNAEILVALLNNGGCAKCRANLKQLGGSGGNQ